VKRTHGACLALAVTLLAGPAAFAQQALHPYPLLPCRPMAGRTGCDGPAVSEMRTEYDAAVAAGDVARADQCLQAVDSESFCWGQPEFLPYSGSVEHVRSSLQRYIPPYPVYNKYSLVKNFVLNEFRSTRDNCVEFAENIYWHTQFGQRIPAQKKNDPVRCYPWQPGSSITLELGKLKPRMMYARRAGDPRPGQSARAQWPAERRPGETARFSVVCERPLRRHELHVHSARTGDGQLLRGRLVHLPLPG
jgi:hypothetical protein